MTAEEDPVKMLVKALTDVLVQDVLKETYAQSNKEEMTEQMDVTRESQAESNSQIPKLEQDIDEYKCNKLAFHIVHWPT